MVIVSLAIRKNTKQKIIEDKISNDGWRTCACIDVAILALRHLKILYLLMFVVCKVIPLSILILVLLSLHMTIY